AELAFDCIGAKVDRYAVVPALSLVLRISEASGQKVEAIALRCQIRIEPARRRYSAAEAERLNDLFGDTARWANTLKPMQFSTVATMVPGFLGATEIELPITFTYDLAVGSARYFDSLEAGEIPLLLLFSGTVFTVVDGRIQVQQVPWSKEAAYRLPVPVWREAIDAHFPNSAWIKMSRQTLEELQRFKSSRALPTWDLTMAALLARADAADQPGPPTRRTSSTPARWPTPCSTRATCSTRTGGRRRRTGPGSSSASSCRRPTAASMPVSRRPARPSAWSNAPTAPRW